MRFCKKFKIVFSLVHENTIMNWINSVTSTVLLVLLGIQSVSHSQYYPFIVYPSSAISTTDPHANSPPTTKFFQTRNYEPPYRQHQHHYHPFNDPSGTSVKHFETSRDGLDVDSTEHSNSHENSQGSQFEFFHFSRRRYNNQNDNHRHEPSIGFLPNLDPFEDTGSVGIDFRRNGEMDISVGNPQRPLVVRINSRPNYMPIGAEASSLDGQPETLPEHSACPDSRYRIYRKDGKCYPLNTNDLCGKHMRFYSEEDQIHGDCDCDFNNGFVSRPLAYWRSHDRCYLLWNRGPCKLYEWLILDGNGIPRCAPRKCTEGLDGDGDDIDKNGENHKFWFLNNGHCYKTGQHYSRFCGKGKENWIVGFDFGEAKPKCLLEIVMPTFKTLLSSVNDLPCKPGHKKLQNGECKRTSHFDYYDDDDYN